MKLLIPFLSILSLGSAINHQYPLRLSDAQREKIQKRMLEQHANGDDLNKQDTCYSDIVAFLSNEELEDIADDNTMCPEDQTDENASCAFNYSNATAVIQIENICVNDLDGRVETVNLINVCNKIQLGDDVYGLYDFIGIPQCIPNTCTDEEAITSIYLAYEDQVEFFEECAIEVSFVAQDKSTKKTKTSKRMKGSKKQKSSPKSKKTKNAKSMKGSKKSKSN